MVSGGDNACGTTRQLVTNDATFRRLRIVMQKTLCFIRAVLGDNIRLFGIPLLTGHVIIACCVWLWRIWSCAIPDSPYSWPGKWVSLYSVVPCGVAVYPGSETASYVLFTSPLGRHASVRLPREVFSDVGVVARKYFITRSFNMSQSDKLFSRVSPWQEGTPACGDLVFSTRIHSIRLRSTR